MSKPFAKMPIEAFLDHRLTLKQLRVLGALYSFADSKTGEAHPKREALAERCGMLPDNISRATSQLAELGWLKKVGGGGYGLPASYAITVPDLDRVEPYPKQTVKPKQNPIRIGQQTLSESDSKTLSESDSKTLSESDRRKEQTIEQTTELTKNRPVTGTLAPAAADAPKKSKLSPEMQEACRLTWNAYAIAYADRYGADPIRNAKINSQVVQFCKRVPGDEAPHIAAFFVTHNSAFYVSRGHQFGNLLADAEKLRTEWATGRAMTAATARQIDSTQSNLNAIEQAVALAAGR